MFQRLSADVEPVPSWFSALSQYPPKYHRGLPEKDTLKLEFKTDPILRRYLSSNLSKKNKEHDQVDLLNSNDADLGFAYRFAEKYVEEGLEGGIDESEGIVRELMEVEKHKFEEQADKILDTNMLKIYLKNRPEIAEMHSHWQNRLEKYPYSSWVLGAKISFDKFIARGLLDMSSSYYSDLRTRRNGMGESDDRYLEGVVRRVREGLYGLGEKTEEEVEVATMTNGEVADKVEEFKTLIESGGGWEQLEDSKKNNVDEFVTKILFGGKVPKIENMEEERVVAFARCDVFGLEFEGRDLSEVEMDSSGLDLTPEQIAVDTHYEDYSFWHRSHILAEDLKEQVKDMLSEEEKDLILQQAAQDLHKYNLERADRLELICDLWETGQYECDGVEFKEGMEGWSDEDVYKSRRGEDFEKKKKRRFIFEENPLINLAEGMFDKANFGEDEWSEFEGVLDSSEEDTIDSEEDEDQKIRKFENLEYALKQKEGNLEYNYEGMEEMERDEKGKIKGRNPLFDEEEIDWFKEDKE